MRVPKNVKPITDFHTNRENINASSSVTTSFPRCGSGGAWKPEEANPRTRTTDNITQTADSLNEPAGASDRLGWQFHNANGQNAGMPSEQGGVDIRVLVAPPTPSVNTNGSGQGCTGQERSSGSEGQLNDSSRFHSEAWPRERTHLLENGQAQRTPAVVYPGRKE